ncbi:hypothetical protein ACHAWF_015897 [Thalassiosira exigua]
MFKVAKEKTSSNNLHGMIYTIWKALASDEEVAEFQCVMLSLPFPFGFTNPRWAKEIDVMLENKKGIWFIHLLRIIGLLEADFNTALKYFFSVEMMDHVEKNGLSDKQWGSRKNHTSIDAGLKKLIAYENARVTKSTMAEISHDKKACYDMMDPSLSVVYAQKQNVSVEICECVGKTKQSLEHHVRTSLGVSSGHYSQRTSKFRKGGKVQGTGDASSKSINQSSVALRSLQKVAPGLVMPRCDGKGEIKHHSIGYVDDTDGHTSDKRAGPKVEKAVAEKLQHQCDSWRRLTELSHGKLALQKTNCHRIAWEWKRGDWELVWLTKHTIVMEDIKGAFAIFEYLRPDRPNIGLGFKLCMDGN